VVRLRSRPRPSRSERSTFPLGVMPSSYNKGCPNPAISLLMVESRPALILHLASIRLGSYSCD